MGDLWHKCLDLICWLLNQFSALTEKRKKLMCFEKENHLKVCIELSVVSKRRLAGVGAVWNTCQWFATGADGHAMRCEAMRPGERHQCTTVRLATCAPSAWSLMDSAPSASRQQGLLAPAITPTHPALN